MIDKDIDFDITSAIKKTGKYEIVRLLGQGSCSRVYLAYDPFAQRYVALKCFSSDAYHRPEYARVQRNLLLTEASLAGKLIHPHIAQIYDADIGEEDGYIAMEYVSGGVLETFCEPNKLLPFGRLVEMLFKCTRALDYAWAKGVIHRDIKPANILLAQPGGSEVKITDFGAAILNSDPTHAQTPRVGSPAYMSPEQVCDKPLNFQTDIYSLGVTMYQLLTARLPFEGGNHTALSHKIVHNEAIPVRAHRPEIPAGLEKIVMRAMQKKRENRYQSWQAFSQDLVQFARSEAATQELSQQSSPQKLRETELFQSMRTLTFFQHFEDAQVWEALRLGKWREVEAGVTLIHKGEHARSFFLLLQGSAAAFLETRQLNSIAPGESFGEMSVFAQNKTSTASVITQTRCSVLEFDADVLDTASSTCQKRFYRAFLSILSERLNEANRF